MNALERRSVASLALLYVLRMLGLFMVLPLLALYAADMPGASPATIGLALGCYGLTQALLQIPFGWLSDRVGRKAVIVGGLAIFALGSVIAAQAESVAGIILGRSLQGAGAIASTLMALVADLTRAEQRTKAMALVGMSIGFAFALALVLGPVLAALGGLAGVFWATAVLAAGGVLIVLWWVPTPAVTGVRHAEVGARRGLIRQSLAQPELARLNFGVFTLHFILVACFLVVPGFLEDSAGIGRERHWLVYLPVLLLSVAGMLPLMRVGERGGRPRAAFLTAIAAVAGAVATLGLVADSALFYAGLWLFFVGFNYLEAALPSLVSKAAREEGRGTAMGVYATCQFLGAFAGGAAGGWLLQSLGKGGVTGACVLLACLWGVTVLRAPSPVAETAPGAGA